MIFRRLRLGHKLSISFTALILLMILITGAIAVTSTRKNLVEQERFRNVVLVKNFATNLKGHLFESDLMEIDNLINGLSEVAGVSSVIVSDRAGKVIGSMDKALLGRTDSELRKFAEAPLPEMGYVFIDEDERYKKIKVPVRLGDEIWGSVLVVFDYNETIAKINGKTVSTVKKLTLLAAIVLVIGTAGSFLIAFMITRPIKELRSRMTEVCKGRFDMPDLYKPLVDCWEYMKCDKNDCTVYGKREERCWLTVGTKCENVMGRYAVKFGDCTFCPVYKINCGDEVGELREAFYEMLRKIRTGIEELKNANKEKQDLYCMAAIGEMSAKVAHEIRNALYSISGAVSYMKRHVDSDIVNDFTAIIADEVKRLRDLSDSFLNFAKPLELRYSIESINSVIDEAVRIVSHDLEDAGIKVVCRYEGSGIFLFDKNQIKQVLLNLILNSVDAICLGGEIRISTSLDRGFLNLAVEDSGEGIETEVVPRIFEPFFTTKADGNGLGLAIVSKIVSAHNGHIDVSSVKGMGTRFNMSLPFKQSFGQTKVMENV